MCPFLSPPIGWWLVQDKGKVGWVPAAYLQKCSNLENGDETGEDDSSNYLGFVVEESKKLIILKTGYFNLMKG